MDWLKRLFRPHRHQWYRDPVNFRTRFCPECGRKDYMTRQGWVILDQRAE